VKAAANLLAYLHEDETEPVAAAGTTWADTVLLFASWNGNVGLYLAGVILVLILVFTTGSVADKASSWR
jgi:hypothetical protein